MNPAEALDVQIVRYRRMTGAQRVGIALELHELACDIARAGIRRQHPGFREPEVEEQLRHRLTLARSP
jgi:hypothetical protein